MSRSPESFLQHYRSVVILSNGYAQHEKTRVKSEQKPWGVYNTSPIEYEKDFRNVMSSTFAEFLKARKQAHGKVFALDVMGTAKFSEIYPVDGEAAITLVDFRNEKQKKEDDENNRCIIADNMLIPQTWMEARKFLHENDAEGFDLITNRPAAGWRTMKKTNEQYNELVQWLMVNKMYRLLSSDGGQLLTQLSFGTTADKWDELNTIPGITIKTKGYFLGLTRETNAPASLPRIT